ncbi:MAG: T9SS type A sorting domain-containing protein [Bacteroidales bacterium]|nr:T9SS type A sorting domain-containing protein [Bacteroidales bacterium]
MRLFRNGLFLLLIMSLISPALRGQEMLVSSGHNRIPANTLSEASFKTLGSDTLQLPFVDDFSGTSVIPNPQLWSDQFAYINGGFALESPSWGVATLDAMDANGAIYEHATVQSFAADQLTSKPINLFYPGDQSVFLSFYYQPGGLGDAPEPGDSLVLEFYSPNQQSWNWIWSVPGSASHEFKQVMIQITSSQFLQQGFRFRFRNYASLANTYEPSLQVNADHWHIDYVYLARNRSESNTDSPDLTLTKPVGSLLINHTAIPWEHFQNVGLSAVKVTFPVSIRNLSNTPRYGTPSLEIQSLSEGGSLFERELNPLEISPFESLDYDASFNYGFTETVRDSAKFRVILRLNQIESDLIPGNDTLESLQVFKNYYAYDDGTAEAGYGLVGEGTKNAKIAYKFRNLSPGDSLVGVQFYFNRSFADQNKKYFLLAIWDEVNGQPGNLLYQQEGSIPVFSGINDFQTIPLRTKQAIPAIFYVGLIQTTPDFLNLGFDRNNNHQGDIFYNIKGTWQKTGFEGSLMIRPLFTTLSTKTSIPVWPEHTEGKTAIHIYPNPVRNILTISSTPETGNLTVSVFDLQGRLMHESRGNIRQVNLGHLPGGLYFVQISNRSKILLREKVILSHEQ